MEGHREMVRGALRSIRELLDQRITIAQLAEAASVSPFHFHRVFKRLTGRGVLEHVRAFRMARAAIDLRTTERGVAQIALDAGYSNPESFSRTFRREMRLSPQEYRLQKRFTMNIQVSLVKIPVTDFDRARAFYRDVLGLPEEFAVEAYGWAQYAAGSVPLCLYVPGQGGGNGAVGGERDFHLSVSDCRAAFEAIRRKGGDVDEIVRSDDGGTFFVVRDPDGNAFKVLQEMN